MDWATAVGTVIGAAVAILGTMIAHILTTRDRRKDEHRNDKRQSYLDFALAAEAAHDGLRRLADPGRQYENLALETRIAMSESGVYGAREKLLLSASAALNNAGERVLRRLGDMRHAIRDGAKLNTLPYHDAYHQLANALWHLRATARQELGYRALQPADLGKTSWDSQETCAFCIATRSATVPAPREPQLDATD